MAKCQQSDEVARFVIRHTVCELSQYRAKVSLPLAVYVPYEWWQSSSIRSQEDLALKKKTACTQMSRTVSTQSEFLFFHFPSQTHEMKHFKMTVLNKWTLIF